MKKRYLVQIPILVEWYLLKLPYKKVQVKWFSGCKDNGKHGTSMTTAGQPAACLSCLR